MVLPPFILSGREGSLHSLLPGMTLTGSRLRRTSRQPQHRHTASRQDQSNAAFGDGGGLRVLKYCWRSLQLKGGIPQDMLFACPLSWQLSASAFSPQVCRLTPHNSGPRFTLN